MQTTRRGLFAHGALSALTLLQGPRSALGNVTITPNRQGPPGDVLISIFLRGGVDGLSVIIPHGDDDYYGNRPTIALGSPHDTRLNPHERALDLDGYFGLHPALAPLMPLYMAGQLCLIHACGSGDETRSHFEAMSTMERGVSGETGPASGWLARHLQSAPWSNSSPLRAVSLGSILPQSLRGASNATSLQEVADLKLHSPFTGDSTRFEQTLKMLYSRDTLAEAGQEALSVLKTLNHLPASVMTKPQSGYPEDDFGFGLHQVALLMKSDLGLEAACLDHVGYDSHVAQGSSQGMLAGRLESLGKGLAAFAADLGPARWNRTTVVVMSEFGRRVAENSGLGTDHGRGGAMLLLGGRSVVGGKVHGTWPGLAAENLDGPGDLKVTTDYRSVLGELITTRLKNPHIDTIFPGMQPGTLGVTHV